MENVRDRIQSSLKKYGNPEKAKQQMRFFKTGKNEYGEGDVFMGVKVPDQRKISKTFYAECSLQDIDVLLNSKIHETRLTALFILVLQYQKSKSEAKREQIVSFYLHHTKRINNWDLVDSSAHHILGHYLHNKTDKTVLFKLATSGYLWEERIAMIACMYDIKKESYDTALEIAGILLHHKHDLIHKAVGWMLKEISKKDMQVTETFLSEHYQNMPRTMLRYAIEKFPETKRQAYLKDRIH
jgi:3-methyladenine DNA glycosylase AlkD